MFTQYYSNTSEKGFHPNVIFWVEEADKVFATALLRGIAYFIPSSSNSSIPRLPHGQKLTQIEWIKESSAFTFWMAEKYGCTSSSQSSSLNFCRTVYIILKSLQEPSDVWLIHHLCLQLGQSKMDSGHSQWLSLVSRQPDTVLNSTSGLNQPALWSRSQWGQGKLHSLLQTSWKDNVRLQHYTCIFTLKYSLWIKAWEEPGRQPWGWSGEGKQGLNNKSAPDPQLRHRNSSQCNTRLRWSC